MLPAPARYFPVEPSRLRMRAGLHPFGTDFGNGAADGLYLQIDREYSRYLSAKATAWRDGGRPPLARWAVVEDSPEAARAHHAVLEFQFECIEIIPLSDP